MDSCQEASVSNKPRRGSHEADKITGKTIIRALGLKGIQYFFTIIFFMNTVTCNGITVMVFIVNVATLPRVMSFLLTF